MKEGALYRCYRCNAFHVGGIDLHLTTEEDDMATGVQVRADCGATLGEDGGDLCELGVGTAPDHWFTREGANA